MKKNKENNESFKAVMGEIGKRGVDDFAKEIDEARKRLEKMSDGEYTLEPRYKFVNPENETST